MTWQDKAIPLDAPPGAGQAPVGPGNVPRALGAGMSRGILSTLDMLPRGLAGAVNVGAGAMGFQPPFQRATPFQNVAGAAGIGTYQPTTIPEEQAAFTGEMLGSSVLPGAAMTPAGGVRALGAEMLAGLGAAGGGLGSEAAGFGRMPGIVAGSLAPSAAATATQRAMLPTGRAAARQRIGAAQRQGVPISAGQAAGGSYLEKVADILPGGAQAKQQLLTRQSDAMQGRLDEMTRGVPEPSAMSAGQEITGGIEDWAGRFRQRASELYDQAETVIPSQTPVEPLNLYKSVQELRGTGAFAGMTENPLVGRLASRLDELETAFTAGQLDSPVRYRDMRELRSMIGRQLSTPSIVSDAPRAELKKLYGSITEDMRRTVGDVAGEGAIDGWRAADDFWRQGMKRVDDILQPIQRRKTPEDVYKAAMSGTREGATRLREIRDTLTDDQWDVVRRTTMRKMGEGRPSGQVFESATEEAANFSPESFLTNVGRLSREARNTLFEGAKDFDDLTKIASGIREHERYLYNPSGTARLLTQAVAPAAGIAAFYDPTMLANIAKMAGGAYGTQRFLQSPMGLDWLTRTMPAAERGLAGIAPRLAAGEQSF